MLFLHIMLTYIIIYTYFFLFSKKMVETILNQE